ncbi:collagenase [Colwellia sp. RSH04]|uniref:collagenase n=1 Tax=Colwellia sp. RSH04 TaxID=2305464 RepID=UPI000E56E856|nr:collagenase [Colwellia sp. RSH04]RHW75334.1 collagenase [Colwellia sp. RSH04]
MIKKIPFLLTAASIALLSACAGHQKSPYENNVSVNLSSAMKQPMINQLLETNLDTLWSQDFNHYQKGLLKQVSHAISLQAVKGDLNSASLDKLSFYLRIYSSFGPDKEWQDGSEIALNNALIALQNMDGFYQLNDKTARLHENYAVALYRLYFLESMQPYISAHIEPLTKLINLYSNTALSTDSASNTAQQYALWEVLRAAAILPYEARRKNKADNLNDINKDNKLQNALINFINSNNAIINEQDWPTQHAAWALGQYYNIYNKQYWNEYYSKTKEERDLLDKDKTSLPVEKAMTELDHQLWAALETFGQTHNKTEQEIKTLFSIPYVVSTFRGKSECKEGSLAGRCIEPTIKEALPIKHVCSDSLFILTQKMTTAQLNDSCKQLIGQEADFHEKLATNNQPVANDFNDQLRVVIFNNAAEYNKYGQLVFDIHTDNGGMYIEGTTQDPDNIATFYSYEHFWVRPEFKVWNLHHEYVHYLDGRFIKYDTFNHFPSHMVWWSEGLAEFISKANNNPKAFKVLLDTDEDKWLTLQQVFDTEYKDGTTQVYQWGYLAVRFMFEKHKEDYHQLAHFLKTDFFKGYKKLLDESGKKYQEEFHQWLKDNKDLGKETEATIDPQKPRQFYRYTYKDYLQPEHLIENNKHMHWQYWHANALNK